MNASSGLIFRQLFDKESSTFTYLLGDPQTKKALIIDTVKEQIDRDLNLIRELGLELVVALDTHVHADHITGSGLLREKIGCKVGLSEKAGASLVDIPIKDGDVIQFGSKSLKALTTPGHTSTCVTYVTEDKSMAFTGDALFIRGCGRTDFQDGSTDVLWDSVQTKIFSLPDDCFIYPAHDYKGNSVSTVREEKAFNPRLGGTNTLDSFKKIMAGLNLAMPAKIHIAVPANLRCGTPDPSSDNKL